VGIHNTMALGYMRNRLCPQVIPTGSPAWKTEQGVASNARLTSYASSFFSLWSSTTPTWEEQDGALSFSDLEHDRVLGRRNHVQLRKLLGREERYDG
jgi:hypothetical protein